MNPNDPTTSSQPPVSPDISARADAPPTEVLPPVPPTGTFPPVPATPTEVLPPVSATPAGTFAPVPPTGMVAPVRRRPFFLTRAGLVTIIVVVVLLAATFVGGRVTAPAKFKVSPGPTVTVVTTAPAAVTAAPSDTATPPASSSSPPVVTASSPASPSAPPPGGGTDLSALDPVQVTGAPGGYGAPYGYKIGPEPVGTTTYPNSIRFTCNGKGYVVYNVAGAANLHTLLGIPTDATNATNNVMSVSFFKDSVNPTSQIGPAFTFALDKPRTVNVPLGGVSQLVIACSATDPTHSATRMDMVLADPVLTAS